MEMERGFELFLCLLISKFELNIYGKDAEIVKGNDIKKKDYIHTDRRPVIVEDDITYYLQVLQYDYECKL